MSEVDTLRIMIIWKTPRERVVLEGLAVFSLFLSFFFGNPIPAKASGSPDTYARAKVIHILESGTRTNGELGTSAWQKVQIRFLSGPEKNTERTLDHGLLEDLRDDQLVSLGQTVVILTSGASGETVDTIIDAYRFPSVLIVIALFFVLVVLFARKRGVSSILGLAISILIIGAYLIPTIARGGDPLSTCLVASVAIAITSHYFSHGISRRTTIALTSSLITLGLGSLLAIFFTSLARLNGLGSEEAVMLFNDPSLSINFSGLLLGGILLGTLGVLDDITTAQTSVVEELASANAELPRSELIRRALRVGRGHIASLVNTLALAYVGAALPLFLLFGLRSEVPLWITLNDQFIVEEVIRTLVGSSALILAVPIATTLAARFLAPHPGSTNTQR